MSIKALLDAEFFPHVIRPARYIGNEWGAVRSRAESSSVRLALCVPEKYDRGMGHRELHRQYRVLNHGATISCERVFLPDIDAVALLREKNIPLFTLESFAPLGELDWIHFLIADSLAIVDMIPMLKLAGIPVRAAERSDDQPLITASGIHSLNPEPIVDFIDGFVVGDLDVEADSIAALLSQESLYGRETLLQQLAKVPGIYVPAIPNQSRPIKARQIDGTQRLKDIVPIQAYEEVNNDRLAVALPQSFDPARTVETIVSALADTGYDELAISADLSRGVKNFDQFVVSLGQRLRDKRVNIVLPPLPVQQYAIDYARAVSFGEKQGIRFNLKSGSERLREAHGHFTAFEQFYQTLANAFAAGWKSARLDFEIGLPEESERELNDLINVIRNCESIRREYGDKTHLIVALSPFEPQPFTEWQWDEMIAPEEYQRRCELIQRSARGRNIQFKVRDAESAYLRNILSRGDRGYNTIVTALSDCGPGIERLVDDRPSVSWREVFESKGIDASSAVSARPFGERLPWDHIEFGQPREQLLRSRQSAFPAAEARDSSGSFKLGEIILAKPELAEQILVSTPSTPTGSFGRRPKRVVSEPAPMIVPRSRIRLQWSKDDPVRFVGHLATMRAFERAIRRAELPVAFSQGFHPRLKLSFGPPLTLGYSSRGEFLDVQLDTPFHEPMLDRLNDCLPEGFAILQGKPVFGKAVSVSSLINMACYEVALPAATAILPEKVVAVLDQTSIIIRRVKNDETNEIDVRDSILNIELHADAGVHLLYMELALGNRGFVRPDEILSTCFGLSDQEILRLKICRTALMVTTGGSRLSPFEVSS